MATVEMTTHEEPEAVLEAIDAVLEKTKRYRGGYDRTAPVNVLRGALYAARQCIVDDQSEISELKNLLAFDHGLQATLSAAEYDRLLDALKPAREKKP